LRDVEFEERSSPILNVQVVSFMLTPFVEIGLHS